MQLRLWLWLRLRLGLVHVNSCQARSLRQTDFALWRCAAFQKALGFCFYIARVVAVVGVVVVVVAVVFVAVIAAII